MNRRCSPWRRRILQRLTGTGKFCRAKGEHRARLIHKYRHGPGTEPEWYRKRELAALRRRIRELEAEVSRLKGAVRRRRERGLRRDHRRDEGSRKDHRGCRRATRSRR